MRSADFYAGQAVFICGSTGGLGQALVKELCARKVRALVLSARREHILQEQRQYAAAHGVEVQICPGDFTDPKVRALAMSMAAAAGCQCLILAAGQVPAHARDSLEDPAAVEQIFKLNALAPLQFLYENADKFTLGTRIALISSQAALYPIPMLPVYGSAKAALSYAVQALQPQFAARRVKLTLIEPGFFDSPMGRRFAGRCWFKISAERTAVLSLNALAQGRMRTVFPWPLAVGIRLLPFFPASLRRHLLRYFAFDTLNE